MMNLQPSRSSTSLEIGGAAIQVNNVQIRDIGFAQSDMISSSKDYSLVVSRHEFVQKMRKQYDSWIADQKQADREWPVPHPEYFKKLDYPSLETFIKHPVEFSDFFSGFIAQETLAAIITALPRGHKLDDISWVINSLDSLEVTSSSVILKGAAWERRRGGHALPVDDEEAPL